MPTWIAVHVYHHGDRDALLRDAIRPALGRLVAGRRIGACFFVRYPLGGDHVRLRLALVDPGEEQPVTRAVDEALREYLDRHPSQRTLAPEDIRETNRRLLATDPYETDDRIHDDDSWAWTAFRPEVDRYGGAELYPASCAYFTCSSVNVLLGLTPSHHPPKRLERSLVVLGREAMGFATTPLELEALLEESVARWLPELEPIVRHADEVFSQSPSAHASSVRVALESAALPLGPARALARFLSDRSSAASRARILATHLHMTSNRLGLSVPEEAYLLRLLLRGFRDAGAPASTIDGERSVVDTSIFETERRMLAWLAKE